MNCDDIHKLHALHGPVVPWSWVFYIINTFSVINFWVGYAKNW